MFVSAFVASVRGVDLFKLAWAFVLLSLLSEVKI